MSLETGAREVGCFVQSAEAGCRAAAILTNSSSYMYIGLQRACAVKTSCRV